ncbi:MAG: hypothetical protein AAFX95_19510 [Cyanobacteria bacterium J06639_16]
MPKKYYPQGGYSSSHNALCATASQIVFILSTPAILGALNNLASTLSQYRQRAKSGVKTEG